MSDTLALERLKIWFSKEVATKPRDSTAWRGGDWMQLSEAEEEVFGLTLDDMAEASTAYMAWESILGLTEFGLDKDSGLQDALCDTYPFLAEARRSVDTVPLDHSDMRASWREFAALLGIGTRVSTAFFAKMRLWEVRKGILVYED